MPDKLLWKPEFRVGVEIIDRQHEGLFKLSNEFLAACVDLAGDLVAERLFSELAAYMRVHLASEEEWMRSVAYPDFAAHCERHDRWRDEILKHHEAFRSGDRAVVSEMPAFIRRWLLGHILHDDQKFSGYQMRGDARFRPTSVPVGEVAATRAPLVDASDGNGPVARVQAQRFRNILANVSDGVLVVDENGRVEFANAAAASILASTPEGLFGSKCPFDLGPESPRDILFQAPGRDSVWVEWILSPIDDWRVGGKFFCVTMKDQTQLRLLIDEIIEARQDAERSLRTRDDLVNMVTHELRTPLAGILGTASLLLESPLENEQRVLARVIEDSGRRMRALLDDLLDVAKIEAGKMELRMGDFSLRGFLADVVRLFDGAAGARGLRLSVEVDREVPDLVRADSLRLNQILSNLVSNAIKFTSVGGVTIVVTPNAPQGGKVSLRMAVRDTGVGIPADKFSRLFLPFSQLGDAVSSEVKGTGLGLTICKRLAELMGGTIGVASVPGQGTTFHVDLVLEPGVEKKAAEGERAAGSVAGHHVLVVDDDPVSRLVTVRMLARMGVTVEVAESGVTALKRADERRFDLILMDCRLPDMSGQDASRAIRGGDGPNRVTRIVAVTAHRGDDILRQTREAGMSALINKPFTLDELKFQVSGGV